MSAKGANPKALPAGSTSLSSLISTLVPILITSAVLVGLFLVLRRTQKRQYAPRTFLQSLRERERTPTLPNGLFNWLSPFMKMPDHFVASHQSIDGYLLLRFLKVSIVISLVGCCITWPLLFSINATGGGEAVQLSALSMSNVLRGDGNNPRYYAHLVAAVVFFSFIWYMIARESIYYINLRQAYLLSPMYANRISSRTVLFASVPENLLDQAKLRRMFGLDKVKNLWIASDCKELEKLVEERDKVALKLEAAEVKLIKTANNARLKSMKKGAPEESQVGAGDLNGESGSVASRWMTPKDRPTHKLKFLIGKKVDTINWCRAELARLIPEVAALQAKHKAGDEKAINSVFVEFYTQKDAQKAFQTVAHHAPLQMAPRWIGVNPDEVIWKNLSIKWWERVIRNAVTIGFVVVLIVFWAIPVAFVGILSNIRNLAETYSWLSFLLKIPPTIFGLISGLLPSVLLAVLMALLPIVLRLAAKLGGMPSLARVELRTQNFYFSFQVVQVFLVTTVASSATAVGSQIAKDPASAPSLLAKQLPSASNFYFSYFIVQGLTLSAAALLQIVGLILFKVLGKFLDSTPRKMYKRWSSLSGVGWGTVFPIYNLLVVISITYSCIAPLMLGFSAVGLSMLYFAQKYNMFFVYNANIDTKGLVYPRALQQLTTGIYLAVVCLIGLFGIAVATGPLILMVIFLIFSILFHISLNSAIGPLLHSLPVDLEVEEESLLALENGQHHQSDKADPNLLPNTTATPTTKKPNMISKFLRPDKFANYSQLRALVPRDFEPIHYSPDVEAHAYFHPAIAKQPPLLWIPRDGMNISKQEILHTGKVIGITDEEASLDEKGAITWNQEVRPPIWEEKVLY